MKKGPTSALQAMRRLCIPADIVVGPVNEIPTPPSIAEVEDQVEAVRGLSWERPVNVEPVTPSEIDRRLRRYLESYYPERFYARRSDAWQTIGVLPKDVGYLEAIDAYQQGQVLGFYDSQSEELVYTGDADLDRLEHFVLAHELTHAIDDQHFDLDRLDDLVVAVRGRAVPGRARRGGGERQPLRDAGALPIPGGDERLAARRRPRAPGPAVHRRPHGVSVHRRDSGSLTPWPTRVDRRPSTARCASSRQRRSR